MITGRVTSTPEALLTLQLRGPHGHEVRVQAVLDTGFTNYLSRLTDRTQLFSITQRMVMGTRIGKDQRIAMVAWLCLCVLFVCVGWYFYVTLYVPLLFTDGVLYGSPEWIETNATFGPWHQDMQFSEKHPDATYYTRSDYFRNGSVSLTFHDVAFIHCTTSMSPDDFYPRLSWVSFQPRYSRIALGVVRQHCIGFRVGSGGLSSTRPATTVHSTRDRFQDSFSPGVMRCLPL